MNNINNLKAEGFKLLNELEKLIKKKEIALSKEMDQHEVKKKMYSNYNRLKDKRKKVMQGIELMTPEIKN